MSIFSRFKQEKKKEEKAAEKKIRKVSSVETAASPAPAISRKGEKRAVGFALVPHLTEKTTAAPRHGWYTFRVPQSVGKIMVKSAVEHSYGIHVERVRVTPIRPRKIRIGRIAGSVPGFKKAMVKVRKGESIEFS